MERRSFHYNSLKLNTGEPFSCLLTIVFALDTCYCTAPLFFYSMQLFSQKNRFFGEILLILPVFRILFLDFFHSTIATIRNYVQIVHFGIGSCDWVLFLNCNRNRIVKFILHHRFPYISWKCRSHSWWSFFSLE